MAGDIKCSKRRAEESENPRKGNKFTSCFHFLFTYCETYICSID